jgi:HD-GYP domain-containing protein (c-di-GMP phosphodiesterase class II)
LNRHPVVGYEILQPIHHPYADVPLAAKYHHERVDGRGYPDGLVDRQIPYIAKIVTLADSFDAMTTDRPYRARRPAKDVIDELRRNSTTQFAPEIATAFLGGMLRELTGEDRTKRFRRLLGREYMEAEGIVDKVKYTLNEMMPTTPMTYVAAASMGEATTIL